ncbi:MULTISPECIES: ribonuclease HII [unclassified Microbacterium]|uniref:ribonuclease HII n=1 Tax=unclassified Microbacterium TaxID=2609290 RepID=UPI00097E7BA7|nr:ribonuclease HII [Microbacterium sp. JB110]RCS62762.1 ribonuclease HII [Microbacterium sp. JB110]SJM62922.1 Ribonuclease HII [Frigoribacterium sp. JB110]
MSAAPPTLELERRLLGQAPLIFALDEVGRGALAGPVAVGASVIDASAAEGAVPEGLKDSKLITEKRRPEVASRAARWVTGSAVGWASPAEIDEVGIVRALGLAALRAIESLAAAGFAPDSGIVLLDGNHDYITPTARAFDEWASAARLDVRPVIKGDRTCASISAASVVSKVARDEHMVALHTEHPHYAWERNKGYASAAHREAIAGHGLSDHHRRSWAIADAPALF